MEDRLEKRVRRAVLLFALVLLPRLSAASAQSRGAYIRGSISEFLVLPLLSLQAGAAVADAAELRGTLDTLVLANILSGDVLLTLFPEPSLKLYLGAGADLLAASSYGDGFAVHTTAGAEYRTENGAGPVGIYGEAKPLLSPAVLEGIPVLLLRGGVNFYF